MDEYGSSSNRHPLPPRHRDPHPQHPQPNSFTQHPAAQPPTVDGGPAQRQPDDPMAFLEFLSCSLCSYPYDSPDGERRAFWATSCGHILCSDPNHRHQNGTCTYCNRQGVVVHPIDEHMPAKLQRWFQPRAQIIAGIGDSLGLLKFQFAELERVTRSQVGTIRQLEATIDECHVSLRAQKTEKEEQARQIEQLNRQVTDMKRQLGEANAQNRALQDQAAAFEQSNRLHQQQQNDRLHQQQNDRLHQHQSHHHQGHHHQSHHHQNHQHLAGPSQGLLFERVPPQIAAHSQDYEAPDFEPMGPPPPKRPRPQDPSQGLPFGPRQTNPEFPPRPSTVVHPRLARQLDSSFNRPASAANFAPVSSTSFAPAPVGVRNNLDKYLHRTELAPSTVPIPQQHLRPSFTLARTSHTQPWRAAARPGAANEVDDDLGA